MTTGLIAAVLLGLRHTTDPDHLTAVSALVLSDRRGGARRAGGLGFAWGLGHAISLFALGVPVVLFRQYLPASIQRLAEATIGIVIVMLAARLLLRWKRGHFLTHEGGGTAHAAEVHPHPPVVGLGRSPIAAFSIGLLHGAGGSAAVGVLLVGGIPDPTRGAIALGLFAAATAVSMALMSTTVGFALALGPVSRRLGRLVPVLGSVSLLFGVWYALSAGRGFPSGP